jgi:hypothetical protein
MINKFNLNFNKIFKINLINIFITLLFSCIYIFSVRETINYKNIFFIVISLLSNTLILYLLLTIILLPIYFIKKLKLQQIILSIVYTLFHIAIFVDASIYRLYKFHFNSMVWNLITTEGAFDSVHLGFFTVLTVIFIVLLLNVILYFVIKRITEKEENNYKITWKKYAIIGTIAIILLDKGIYAYSDITNNYMILRFSKLFPLYQPLTMKRFAEKVFKIKIDRENELKIDNNNSSLKYPLGKIDEKIPNKLNVIFIVIDSWRYDMLDSTVCPNIFNFSKKSIVLNNHYSGGNATRFGIFSIFYGLDGTYWHQFLAERRSPIFIDILQKNCYEFFIGSSTKLTYPEFRKTVFVNLYNNIYDNLNGNEAKDKDPQLKDQFINFLDKRDKAKPFFSFLFFDAPHGPYSYPQEFDKFKPSRSEINFVTMNKNQAAAIKNTYKNGIYFDDNLIGKIIEKLEISGIMDNTIIFITGDHGEEFYESGFAGHTSAFSKQQAKVAAILYLPNMKHQVITNMTNHFDIVPTILNFLGNKSDYSLYTEGENIFNKKKNYSICSGWDKAGIIFDDYTIVFSTETYNAANFEVRDNNYNLIYNFGPILHQKKNTLKEVVKSLSKFKN